MVREPTKISPPILSQFHQDSAKLTGTMKPIALFGIRSPLTVEYEETCHRAGIAIPFAVTIAGAPRLHADVPILVLGDLRSHHLATACIVCAFSPIRRRALAEAALAAGLTFAEALVDPASTIASSANLGVGSYVNAGCVIGGLSIIGNHVVVNRSSSAGHHAVLADYVSIGPGVTLAGNIRVGEGSVIGAGSTVLPGIRIGAGAVIAAGSVVRKDVLDGTMVAGNPAVEHAFDPLRSSLHSPDAE
jgi:sugar O-acyltransferase (sialic acid O-acetyltransferase NeuD family)